jgi:hypothetical protein
MSYYQEEENQAYCSGQCQASRYPPVTCRCPCGGRNHGILRYRNPVIQIPREQGYENSPYSLPGRNVPLLENRRFALPHIQPKPQTERAIYPVARGTKKVFKKLLGIRSSDDLNTAVLKGLRYQFNAERTEAIVDQAFTFRMSERPNENRPELYELYETGEIDRATEFFGSRWVIGRPKIR